MRTSTSSIRWNISRRQPAAGTEKESALAPRGVTQAIASPGSGFSRSTWASGSLLVQRWDTEQQSGLTEIDIQAILPVGGSVG